VVQLAEGYYQLSLAACAGQTLLGTQQVAWVQVATATNQSSAFVPLNLGDAGCLESDGSSLTNLLTQAGRLVVVGSEPLLEFVLPAGGQPALVLYSQTGMGFR
jgi:hypothetical protein